MKATPGAARVYICCAVLAALACVLPAFTLPALRPFSAAGPDSLWPAVLLLGTLYALCETPARFRLLRRPVRGSVPVVAGSFFPVLLAAAFLLPPAAAALVAVPGGLCGRVARRPAGVRRVWRAAQLAIATWATSLAHRLLAGPAALGGTAHSGHGSPGVPDFPYALLPAGAGALAFCLVLSALDGGIFVTAERQSVRTAWRGLLPRSLAPYGAHALAGLMMAVLWRSPYGPPSALFVLLPVYISCWVFAQYHRERAAHQATIRALVQAVDIKDRYTRGHSERVGRASAMIARELGMDHERLEVLRFAGILHDVGKLGVPTRVLRKDGPLTPEERRVIELHPEYGHEIVRGIGFLGEARLAILHHHERLDGSGYPYGLAGAEIPEFARVVAVADAFDAMTSTRSYRRARPVATALVELRRCAGSQFDPRMVGALVSALDRYGWQTDVTSDEAHAVPAAPREPSEPPPRAPAVAATPLLPAPPANGATAVCENVPPPRPQDRSRTAPAPDRPGTPGGGG
ncbi:HD-GYP domain-containing protein [Streptomyces sp. NBC_01716]|uniref:HD-GYP domain-containing protein n=1 Tax=Streptomyces sp. NBC_01716 TaxID=2975917 RepID=UPI002E377917|nr:HD-GYP domain-containing protein [Streptomyces sp. NBC_01716]